MPSFRTGRAPLPGASALGLALAAMFVVLAWSSNASAYAWMIRHGYGGCGVCHADPSGGELLTRYGRSQGDLILRMRYSKDSVSAASSEGGSATSSSFDDFDDFDDSAAGGKEAGDEEVGKSKRKGAGKARKEDEVEDLDDEEPKEDDASDAAAGDAGSDTDEGPSTGFLWGVIDTPDWLLLGGSYRHLTVLKSGDFSTFPMQADLYGQLTFGSVHIGGSLGIARVAVGSPHARAAQVTSGQGKEMNLLSRTHWIGMDLDARREFLLRAGRINVPFGVRITEHVMWIREATKTDRESDQQHGLALSYSGSLFRAEVMAIAGNYQINPDRYRERGYSTYVETLVTEPFATGVSSLMTVAQADNITLEEDKTIRGAHGVFFRVKVSEPIVVLFEADALHKSRRELGYVGFVQLDYEPVQGLHFGATGEVLDRGYRPLPSSVAGIDIERVAGVGKPRLGGWLTVDWFFLPQLEMRVDAIVRQQDPFTLLGQLHVYL